MIFARCLFTHIGCVSGFFREKFVVVWRDTVRVTPIFKSDQLITCSILLPDSSEEILCSFVYALNTVDERRRLWEDLSNHHDCPMFRHKPWIIMGDFNEILRGEEHSGFENSPSIPQGMRDFQGIVTKCRLMDMGFHGPAHTWCNKREEGLICKKLDRVLINDAWLDGYSQSYCVFEAGGCSDQLRCRIRITSEERKTRKPFKFTNTIAKSPEFIPLMQSYWDDTEAIFHSTSAMFRLSKKLKDLKQPIRTLSKDKLGELPKRTREAHLYLCDKQKETMENPTVENLKEETRALKRWQLLADLEEEFLKQRSKLHWLNVGDRNNKVFHNAVKISEIRNSIREIVCADGTRATTDDQIKQEAVTFFSQFLNSLPDDYEGTTVERLQELLGYQCSETEQESLQKEVTEEEVKNVIFRMPGNKAPGPDGFTCEFLKEAWPVIGKDVTIAIQSFFIKGFLPKGINSTILALIPKKEDAKVMRDYQPISCCNVLYKAVSKILANRLKGILPNCIALNQSAFIKDRLLMENLLLATELVKDYHKESVSPRCAMKIDISKAFDSVQWPFLLNVLKALGLPSKFIHWINLCISTASFSVQVNGELAGYFQSTRGLRQGCSLSPYLFVICMNVLSKMIDEASAKKRIGYHPRCQHIELTHLCFADDLMVFADGSKRSIEGILAVFDEFAKMSGLHISLEKSTMYLAGVSISDQGDILSHFPFSSGQFPVRYLGLPLLTKKMTANDYLPLIEKIRNRIGSWTGRFLSFAGRVQLINSVIASLTNFWLAAFRLPSTCLEEVEKLCSAFLWSGPELNTRKAKIAWKDVCKEKMEGGLGVKSLKEVNKVCCLKLVWRILSAKSSLWVNWIHVYLIRKGSFWTVRENTTTGSWMWKKILKYRDEAKLFYRVDVRSGETTSFWYDTWSPLGCLVGLLGNRGRVDMGIPDDATVADVMSQRRRRRHRVLLLNKVEEEIVKCSDRRVEEADVGLWKCSQDKYKKKFSSKATWSLIRCKYEEVSWYKGIWFPYATPKYSLLLWIAIRNRLSTGDRMLHWNLQVNLSCVLCSEPLESRDHLFFDCVFTKQIWETAVKGILLNRYTSKWQEIIDLVSGKNSLEKTKLFIVRYAFQLVVHIIWRERNSRRHGEQPSETTRLSKLIDKSMRNRLISIQRTGDEHYSDGLQLWFGTRLIQ